MQAQLWLGLVLLIALFPSNGAVGDAIKLDANSFVDFISKGRSIVRWQRGAPSSDFAHLGRDGGGSWQIGWIDCDWSKAKKLCDKNAEVEKLPYINVYTEPGDAEDYYTLYDADGKDARAILDFANGKAPDTSHGEAKSASADDGDAQQASKAAEHAEGLRLANPKDQEVERPDSEKTDFELAREGKEVPVRKDYKSVLTKKTCVDFCYSPGCPTCKAVFPLIKRMVIENPKLTVKWHNWVGEEDERAICNTLKLDFDGPFQVPLIFFGNGTAGRTSWKSPKTYKKVLDANAFVYNPNSFLKDCDGCSCKSSKYVKPSFRAKLGQDYARKAQAKKEEQRREEAASQEATNSGVNNVEQAEVKFEDQSHFDRQQDDAEDMETIEVDDVGDSSEIVHEDL